VHDLLKMILCVVSQRVDWISSRAEARDALDQRLVQWLWQVGVTPLQVPNALQSQGALVSWISTIAPKAVVLSGGNNIGDCSERDATETVLLNFAAQNNLPVLGICRGMQMMAVAAGASLERVEGHAGSRHTLRCDRLYKDSLPLEVNSFHEWRLKTCPVDFEMMAKSLDGTIEAIRHKTRSWEGWMWHPERENPFSDIDLRRAKSLFFKDP